MPTIENEVEKKEDRKITKDSIIILLTAALIGVIGWGGYGKWQDYKAGLIKTAHDSGVKEGADLMKNVVFQELNSTGMVRIGKDKNGNDMALVPQIISTSTIH